jgi:hypothetical protein
MPAPVPPLTWRYPFPGKDGKEIIHPQTFYNALAAMDDGYFPLGVNGFPHGGVHFGAGSAPSVDQGHGVRCLADGEIVAYKLDATYPHLHFTQDDRWAMYSTGFVLVRHTLTLPPVPGSPAARPVTQTLFSLYLHLADWATYAMDNALVRPGWWPGVSAFRVGKADRWDGQAGAHVRAAPTLDPHGRYHGGRVVDFLPEGSEVQIGERQGPWGHITAIAGVEVLSEDDPSRPGDLGWIYLHEQHALAKPAEVGSIVIPPQPIPVKAGTWLGQLGEYIDYERSTPLPPRPTRQMLHLEVFAGADFPTFLEESRARAAQLPADQKTVLVVTPGTQLVADAARPDRPLAKYHPERFTLVLPTPDSPAEGRWVKVQPHYHSTVGFPHDAPDGPPVWIERTALAQATATTPAWSTFPLHAQATAEPVSRPQQWTRAELDAFDERARAVDDKGLHWWCIPVDTDDGRGRGGWVAQDHPGTAWESPWAWPGFEIVDATGIDLADAFKRNLIATGGADYKEQSEWKSATASVQASPLFQTLQQTVGAQHYFLDSYRRTPDPNAGKITPRSLERALRHRGLAQALSHMILTYESEWGGNLARWEALTPWMRTAKENWQCELQRIQSLQWWDEVKGKVEEFPQVWWCTTFIRLRWWGISCPHAILRIESENTANVESISERQSLARGSTFSGLFKALTWNVWQKNCYDS